ncbi:protein phosphatase 2C containing protein (macronuclear) [Tetrahymena thermophila SB210]|uniref:Protein phosphatase 2C containing protein n=1 Tax=Tetrahymena thermophila (strain SB210) TaxID=312017 RepID=I7MA07_TETTS|nr:protein phosphatase 2C containing protein [Tetrahymena thermophila SB210]EAS03169.2 protein phosphatase 2C containing protein [Tetrahymena thermophila SB210]|eukprot:XP_001023414.2 protein phosphatase 2C containing protein [Tetrahymena thermophila SB210]
MMKTSQIRSNYQAKKIYMPRALGVKEYAFYDDINIQYRQTMEDGFFIADNFLDDGGKSILFGVLDGHGGSDVVEFVKQNFTKEFSDEYKKTPKDVVDVLKRTFLRVDELVKQKCKSQEVGSTACIGFIRLEEAKRVLYIANVGDTAGLVLDDTQAHNVTIEHKASNPREIERIKKAGGSVIYDRVAGVLAVSRAFGDHSLRNFGVIAQPDVTRMELRMIHKYLVVASDGLWDVVIPKEVLEVSKLKSNSEEVAAELLKRALLNGSRDNTSVMVLRLN